MDDLIFKYRYLIGGILLFVIVSGLGVLWFDKTKQTSKVKDEQIIELQKQNDELRAQLSSGSRQVAGATDQIQTEKININTADATTLDKLPNIGPARAASILDYRQAHGGFETIEEIKNIKGIGDKSFEELKSLITVGE